MEKAQMNKIRRRLEKEGLYVRTIRDSLGYKAYMVVDANNIIQTSEHGMSESELIDYAMQY